MRKHEVKNRSQLSDSQQYSKKNNKTLTNNIKDNIAFLENMFTDCSDIVFRQLSYTPHKEGSQEVVLVFIDGLVDSSIINDGVIKQINIYFKEEKTTKLEINILKNIILVNDIKVSSSFDEIIECLLSGLTVLFIEEGDEALLLNTRGWESRAVDESTVETVIRGPKEGFVEDIRTNTAMIRRKLRDPNIKIKNLKIGDRSNTNVAIIYIDDIINRNLLDYIIEKLENVKIDAIFDSGYIEQMIEGNSFTIFPQVQITERPDKVCANLLEGRISIIVDGSPDALIFPVGLAQFFQSPEDYYERVIFANIVRFIRFIGFLIATTFPAIYVAITTFHQEILPTLFILDIAKSRVQVPFPPVIEALLMEGTIELLREASSRLPIRIGQTIGIVGVLVIGDAAVRAGIISSIMVIVVAITAIGSYIFPHFSTSYAMRFIRLPMIIMASSFGAFGIIITWSLIIAHMCKLNSFGYPYLTPLAPTNTEDFQDTFLRSPLWSFKKRPIPASNNNKRAR